MNCYMLEINLRQYVLEKGLKSLLEVLTVLYCLKLFQNTFSVVVYYIPYSNVFRDFTF